MINLSTTLYNVAGGDVGELDFTDCSLYYCFVKVAGRYAKVFLGKSLMHWVMAMVRRVSFTNCHIWMIIQDRFKHTCVTG